MSRGKNNLTRDITRGKGDLTQNITRGKALSEDEIRDVLKDNIRQIMDSSGAAMRILDTEFNVVLENDRMREMGGIEAEGQYGTKCYDQFCNDKVCGTGNCTLKQIVDEGQAEIRVEVEKESYDGRVIPTELVVKPIHDEHGNVVGISETFRDISRLKGATGSIKSSIDDLKQSSRNVAATSQEISSLADEQTDSINEVSSEVSSLSATVEEIAATADEVSDVSERARGMANEGEQEAETTIDVMGEIETSQSEVMEEVSALQKNIQEIDELVAVINDIADQTNLLALNASIEAARAGEAGDGFAVVANEVKSLAEESQQRAGEIEGIVTDIRDNTDGTVESLEETTEVIRDGVGRARGSGETFQEIAAVVEEAYQGVQGVAEATDDQAASSEEIASMVDEAADNFEDVASMSEEIAAANEEQTTRIERISEEIDSLDELDVQSDA